MIGRILFLLWFGLLLIPVFRGNYPQAADLGLKFVAFFLTYVFLVAFVTLGSQLLLRSQPLWADRLACLLGWLTPSQNYRVNRLAIYKENFAKADQIWSEVSGKLATLPAGTALALTANYSASLSARGQYSRALELLLPLDPSLAARSYRLFVGLYWLNRGFYELQLGRLQEARASVDQAQRIQLKNPALLERLQGLEILVAYELGDHDKALSLLHQSSEKRSFSAMMLALLGEPTQAAQRLPDPERLREPGEHCYDHLARMWLAEQPEDQRRELRAASETGYMAGLVAWQALKCLGEPAFLREARLRDPESLWTRRAEELVSQMQERS